jgi:hypothetical protein
MLSSQRLPEEEDVMSTDPRSDRRVFPTLPTSTVTAISTIFTLGNTETR